MAAWAHNISDNKCTVLLYYCSRLLQGFAKSPRVLGLKEEASPLLGQVWEANGDPWQSEVCTSGFIMF